MARAYRNMRIELGKTLLLGLEILIISDILHSIVKRTVEELIMVAITVAIRIVLSYFLDRELFRLGGRVNGQENNPPSDNKRHVGDNIVLTKPWRTAGEFLRCHERVYWPVDRSVTMNKLSWCRPQRAFALLALLTIAGCGSLPQAFIGARDFSE